MSANGLVSVNGTATDINAAYIPASDRGFLFGDSVFETLVAFGSKLLDVGRHLERLRRSSDDLGISVPWSDAELTFEMQSLVEQVGASKSQVRLIVSRGSGQGLRPLPGLKPNKMIFTAPARIESPEVYEQGISCKRKVLPFTERGPSPKTSNYLRAILALQQCEREGFDELIWTNSEGEITEAATANVFFIGRFGDNVQILTPGLNSGLLPGITRETLLRLMKRATIPFAEQTIYADEIPRFDEAFVCSSVRGLVPVQRIDQHRLQTARPTSVFRHIERLFLAWVESELGQRLEWNTGKKQQRPRE